jgi:hypothetical protein
MKTSNIEYTYDPAKPQLVIWEDGKPRGGFTGEYATKHLFELLSQNKKVSFMNIDKEKEKRKLTQNLMAVWVSLGIADMRRQIIAKYGVESTTQLTEQQLDMLLHEFSAKYQQEPTAEVRRQRSEVMTLLTRYGTYSSADDWARVNRFLIDKRIAGKLLFQMSVEEMQVLKRKLHKLIADKERKENEVKRQIMMN